MEALWHFSVDSETIPRICFSFTGERQLAAIFIIFGPMPSNPVALKISSEFMTENTFLVDNVAFYQGLHCLLGLKQTFRDINTQ